MRLTPHDELVLPDDGPYWWVCTQPERPHDEWACYWVPDCRACEIAMEALARRDPDAYLDRHDPDTGERTHEGTAASMFASVTDSS